jgi:hypothetical protein
MPVSLDQGFAPLATPLGTFQKLKFAIAEAQPTP